MTERIDVFISSTREDLTDYLKEVESVLLDMGMFPIGMEHFPPNRNNPLQVCFDEVQNAQAFIGIYAHRYGYVPDNSYKYLSVNPRKG